MSMQSAIEKQQSARLELSEARDYLIGIEEEWFLRSDLRRCRIGIKAAIKFLMKRIDSGLPIKIFSPRYSVGRVISPRYAIARDIKGIKGYAYLLRYHSYRNHCIYLVSPAYTRHSEDPINHIPSLLDECLILLHNLLENGSIDRQQLENLPLELFDQIVDLK